METFNAKDHLARNSKDVKFIKEKNVSPIKNGQVKDKSFWKGYGEKESDIFFEDNE